MIESRGIALVVTLIVIAVLSALGMGLLLTTSAERLTGANQRDAIHALNAAEAALELASRELALVADWNLVLTGAERSRMTDGPPSGPRTVAHTALDLGSLTNQITCDLPTACSDTRVQANTRERPWGMNNPRWQPFLYGRLSALGPVPPLMPDLYVVVWIGDDARERDGASLVDDGLSSGTGRDVVRARAEAFSAGGTRRAVEADFIRPCEATGGVRTCRAGIRVQSWRVRTDGIP